MTKSDQNILDEITAKIAVIDREQGNYLARVFQRTSVAPSEYWYCRGLADGYKSRDIIDGWELQFVRDTLDQLLWGCS